MKNIKYLLAGIVFGIILVKSEVISWWRIQEMFRFQDFHMFGVIGSAVITGIIITTLIKKFKVKTMTGKPIEIKAKSLNKGTVIGSTLFGIGWAITGACPGPIYAQIGAGFLPVIITLISAIVGVLVYGILKYRLPH